MLGFLFKKGLKLTGLGLTVKETVPAKVYKRFMDAYNAGSKAGGGMMEMRKKGMGLRMKDGGATFPDLSGDGKITQKDILMGRGVIRKKAGGMVKKRAKSKSKKSRGMGVAKRGGKFKGTF